MGTRPQSDPQQTAQCVCECGRSYIGETDGPLAVRPRAHRLSIKGKIIANACEYGYKVGWEFE
jgi:hypothetical protein